MNQGFCLLAERHIGPFPFEDLAGAIRHNGLHLQNPSSGLITRLSDEGDQIALSEAELSNFLNTEAIVTFQFWFSESHDVVCSFRRLRDGLYVEVFSLGALDRIEQSRIALLAKDRFKDLAVKHKAVAVIVDRRGVTAEYDWDAFLLGSRVLPTRWPELIGLDADTALFFEHKFPLRNKERLGNYVLFRV